MRSSSAARGPALLGVAFVPDVTGELGYARGLLEPLYDLIVLPADAYYYAHDAL